MNPGSSRGSSPATRGGGGRRNSGIEQSLAETALQALDERELVGPELRRGYEPPVAFVGLERLLGRQGLPAAAAGGRPPPPAGGPPRAARAGGAATARGAARGWSAAVRDASWG